MHTFVRWLRQIAAHAPAVVVGLALLAAKSAPLAAAWCAASRLAYVGYVAAVLLRRSAGAETRGERDADAAWRAFRVRASWLMDNDAVALGALCLVTRGTLDVPLPAWATVVAGVLLVAAGLGVKAWAAASLPDGAYHWRSFFVTDDVVRVSATGPYRWLANPMYTLGYAHAYGFALVFGSLWGLLAAAFAQSLMLLLAAVVERPHFLRLLERAVAADPPRADSTTTNPPGARTPVSRVP